MVFFSFYFWFLSLVLLYSSFIHVSLLMFRFLIHFYSCFLFMLLLILVSSPLIFSGLLQFRYFLFPLFSVSLFPFPFFSFQALLPLLPLF